ncbi:hypothetical protein Q1W73_05035 [Asticcacaulis sp. ZE23SCel15]|uniref:hypothetical protein n=1 Tax=Asticcacaulis sp. ZE23SCel15 TaxID=3059027 RepID=UPI00265E976A|nr:hypothetical protein [Asticcacaulis sp. ZE23SCel15]WKL58349.1 hypothetical protein Q1W73_05035 [Asticcacaulis sp. ZE23SCel15]
MKFTIGNTLNEGFGLLSRHFSTIFMVGLVTYGLPLIAGVVILLMTTGFNLADSPEVAAVTAGWWTGFGVYMVIAIVASLITFSMITEIVIRDKFEFGAAFGRALKNIIPLIIITLLYTLAMMLGMILLIIPGIIVMLMFYVTLTAYIAEPGLGIGGAFTRSRELTKGHRWAILAILLIVGIAIGVLGMIFNLPLAPIAGGTNTPVFVGLSTLVSVLTSIASLVFSIAIYTCLRRAKETHTPETVANVFS